MAAGPYQYGKRSKTRLKGVHPDLRAVFELAITLSPDLDWTILEGVRTSARQRQLVAEGKSQTFRSRHLTGHAVDAVALVDGEIVWDIELQRRINGYVQEAAKALGVKVEWGGNWKTLVDGPHWQLSWKDHPR